MSLAGFLVLCGVATFSLLVHWRQALFIIKLNSELHVEKIDNNRRICLIESLDAQIHSMSTALRIVTDERDAALACAEELRKQIAEIEVGIVDMKFGEAIEAMKNGKKVARSGWDSEGMHIFLEKGSFDGPYRGFAVGEDILPNHPSTQDGISMSLFESCEENYSPVRLPRFCMKSVSGAIVVGWLASQTDMLSSDWLILES